MTMKRLAQLFFEARSLKQLSRSGYQFLGTGRESVAEHSFTTAVIAYVMGQTVPDVDHGRLVTMSLLHDLPEARIGDLNYVQKFYVQADEGAAIDEMTDGLPFGDDIRDLIDEFNRGESREARLARDADQLAFLVELKSLADLGHAAPPTWIPNLIARLQTDSGRAMAAAILETPAEEWWRQKFIDRTGHTQ
jgi:putative hydrolase of HD superfamily